MGRSKFNSAALHETQVEQDAYAILAYQKKIDDFNIQASVFTLYSSVLFRPDDAGDLIFNGVASRVDRDIFSNGFKFDASYKLNDQHTLRGGMLFSEQHEPSKRRRWFFRSMPMGTKSATFRGIVDNSDQYGYFYGFYSEDEWKPFEQLTINFGGRIDFVDAFVNEIQLNARLNVVYEPFKGTAFTPATPAISHRRRWKTSEQGTISKFQEQRTSRLFTRIPSRSERAHYFDAGMTQKVPAVLMSASMAFINVALGPGRRAIRGGAYSFVV